MMGRAVIPRLLRSVLAALLSLSTVVLASVPAEPTTSTPTSIANPLGQASNDAAAGVEWRVLGPAFSDHFTKQGALRYETPPTWDCTVSSVQEDSNNVKQSTVIKTFTTADPFDAGKSFIPAGEVANAVGKPSSYGNPSGAANGGLVYTATGTFAYDHATQIETFKNASCETTSKPGQDRSWHQNNPAFGLQRAWRYRDHVDLVYATFVRDSYGSSSFMVGGGREWPLAKLGTVAFEGGLVAGLWRRSEVTNDGWALERRTVPFILPALSINESKTGIGLNVAIAPRAVIDGHCLSSTTTAMFQLTYLIHKTAAPGVTDVSLQTSPEGGAQASIGYAF